MLKGIVFTLPPPFLTIANGSFIDGNLTRLQRATYHGRGPPAFNWRS
jgi:hypothetical protein